MSNAVASVLGFHCDGIHAVLHVSGVVSIFDCLQSAKLQKNWSLICSVVRFFVDTVC